jgi:rod shape-determining protein MreC
LRLTLSVAAHPVQQAAALPTQALGRVADYFATQDELLRENRELKAKVLEQAAAAQEARLLRGEQEHLLNLSEARTRYAEGGTVAEVIYTARNPFTRKVVVNRGLSHGIKAGQPVIDGSGVVGQVTHVAAFTSEVTLVTEKDQSVPVMLERNGLRAVAVGSGKDGSIDVPFMPVSADIVVGDTFVTSGIDATYPPGLVVARVGQVDKNPAAVFARIVARPAAAVENHRFVLVLPLPATPPPRPETKGEETAKKSRDRPRPRRGER